MALSLPHVMGVGTCDTCDTCDEFQKNGLSTAKLVNRNEIGDFINMEVEDRP